MTHSASAMTSRLWLDHHHGVAGVHQAVQDADQLSTSAHVRPTVGSSRTKVRSIRHPARLSGGEGRVLTFASIGNQLIRCASPPESVGLCWPRVR